MHPPGHESRHRRPWASARDGSDTHCQSRVQGAEVTGSANYGPTSATEPQLTRTSSSELVGNTQWGWPAAAQTISYLASQVSTRVVIDSGWPTGATPPMVNPV